MAFGFRIPNIVKAILPWSKSEGGFFFETWNMGTNFDKHTRLRTVLENPAALFIFMLLPDLCSMGRFKMYESDQDDAAEITDHPLLDLLRRPNPLQTRDQFMWDYMFWRLLGSANMLSDSKVLKGGGERGNRLFWLSPDSIKWPKWFTDHRHSLFLSDEAIRDLMGRTVNYTTENQDVPFKYGMMKQFFDISNGVSGWFDPPSRVDALYKIIKNSDNILNAKNVNSLLAKKYIVSGKHDVRNVSTLPMGSKEKDSVEREVMGSRSIHGMKSMVDIKRFVERMDGLQSLDKAYMNDAFFIGKMLNIPKDVIESFESGATYENQEKARATIISYCVQPAADDFCQGILDFYGLTGVHLELQYAHLPFVQTFERERAETNDKNAAAFKKLVEGGADQMEASEACGFTFTKFGKPILPGNRGEEDTQNEETE